MTEIEKLNAQPIFNSISYPPASAPFAVKTTRSISAYVPS
jgi:hypothetical protein